LRGWKELLILLLFFFSLTGASFSQPAIDDVLPPSWSISKRIMFPEGKLPAFSSKLGGEIVAIENFVVDASGIPLQINIVKCRSDNDAKNIFNTLLSIHKTTEKCLRINSTVYEFVCKNRLVTKKARSLFNTKKVTVVWEANLVIAPLAKSRDIEWNAFFNLLRRYRKGEAGPEIKEEILKRSKYFEFGDVIAFSNRVIDGIKPEYRIDAVRVDSGRDDLITFKLNTPKRELNIPEVEVVASIPVQGFAGYKPQGKVDIKFYTMPTEYWPSDSPEILSILDKILGDGLTEIQKLQKIQSWVYRNIRYAGAVGSRYGVHKVMSQGFGRCWDKCDLLITLCRAAKIPARQIMGWVDQMGGHIWAEAYIKNEGWIQLDATASFLGVSEDYVPFFIIEDGRVPAVYWDPPVLKRKKLL